MEGKEGRLGSGVFSVRVERRLRDADGENVGRERLQLRGRHRRRQTAHEQHSTRFALCSHTDRHSLS